MGKKAKVHDDHFGVNKDKVRGGRFGERSNKACGGDLGVKKCKVQLVFLWERKKRSRWSFCGKGR